MNQDAFEQLVSAWLDDPQRTELRAQIDSVAAADPALARLLEQHVGLDRLLRDPAAGLPPIAWNDVKARIASGIDQDASAPSGEVRLDEHLRALPAIESQVDWATFRRRVTAAIERDGARQRVLHLPGWRTAIAAGVLATAAAFVAFMLTHPHNPPASGPITAGQVHCRVLSPTTTVPGRDSRPAVACVQVIEEADEPSEASGSPNSPESAPEVYFMLEPPQVLAMASANLPGSH